MCIEMKSIQGLQPAKLNHVKVSRAEYTVYSLMLK